MNFMKDDLWREKTELMNLRLSKLARAKVLLSLEFDSVQSVFACDMHFLYTLSLVSEVSQKVCL